MQTNSTLFALASAGALVAALAGSALPGLAQAAVPPTLYVSVHGKAGNPGTEKAPLASIQAAVSQARAGATIVVMPGTYHEMVTVTKRVTIESAPKLGNADNTVIDAKGEANGILIEGSQASGTTIHGLGVENANDAGILAVGPLADLTFSANYLADNSQVKPPKKIGDWETLHIEGVTHSRIVNNVVVANRDGGIYLTDEPGPTAYNLIKGNLVVDNLVDCGITLASHVKGHGVYNNQVIDNVSEHNGAAGVVLATAVPGGIVRDNVVEDNTVKWNGLGGVVLHTHAPGSVVAGNRIIGNLIGYNSADLSGSTMVATGVDVSASGSPITGTLIAHNRIVDEADPINVTPLAKGTAVKANVAVGVNAVTHITLPAVKP